MFDNDMFISILSIVCVSVLCWFFYVLVSTLPGVSRWLKVVGGLKLMELDAC